MLASGLLLVTLPACLTVMVLMSVWQQRKSRGKLPPGPTPLPFIGNYLQLNTEQMYNSLMKALVDQAEEFSGRGEQATFDWLFKGYGEGVPKRGTLLCFSVFLLSPLPSPISSSVLGFQGVVFSNRERAKQLRRFSIATLRDFGVGKRGIEERIQEEAGFLIQALRGTHGANVDPTFFLSRTVSNVISSIVFGDRFDYEDKEFLSLLGMMLGSFQFTATSTGQVTGCSPARDAPTTTCQLLSYLETGGPNSHLPPDSVPSKSAPNIGQLDSCTRTQEGCPIPSLQGHLDSSTDAPQNRA
ncbi:cytochrome P450 2A13-like [Symphalangus syndactylus]|uniref:cytochrome P450 2A13-like n=1 Tax=Symphalangus syndactylus TaxID=9590 RepID=UPI003004E041